MERLPFDPGRLTTRGGRAKSKRARGEGASAEAGGARERPLSVSQLSDLIGGAIRDGLPPEVRVVGEVSGFRDRTHWYFDLKDQDAVVNCVMFATSARRAGFTPENGQEVVVTGRVELYARTGKVSLLATKVEPVGAGALELAFRRLCDELRALGWFDEARKRPLPAFPKRIAVVTSRTGAALQDVLDTMRRRCAAVEIALVDVRVQGQAAAPEVAGAVRWLGKRRRELGIDAILVTRGGGSMEDLWAFNERMVAEAIVRSPVPVVAAIGHETDTTIAELVADLRCATPTQAAMRLTPDGGALAEQVDVMADRLTVSIRRMLREESRRVQNAARHPFLADPRAAIRRASERAGTAARHLRLAQAGVVREAVHRLERVAARLEAQRPTALHAQRAAELERARVRLDAAIRYRLACVDVQGVGERLRKAATAMSKTGAARVEALERQLGAVGPASVLRRGFSYTQREDGRLVRSAGDVLPGDVVRTVVADGAFESVVQAGDPAAVAVRGVSTEKPAGPGSRARPRKADRKDGRAGAADQMDLFGS